jgi:hypothetical protein
MCHIFFTTGYQPSQTAYLDGMKVYRNVRSGIFVHKCHNIVLVNGLFADNYLGVDLDRTEGIEVKDTTIIGLTDLYKQLMTTQKAQSVCQFKRRVGLDLHTWKLQKIDPGILIKNVTFCGFSDTTSCPRPSSIHMDNNTLKDGQFELYTLFQGVKLTDGYQSIDFCSTDTAGIDTVYLLDGDGSLSPPSVKPKGMSVLLSNGPDIQRFVTVSKCTKVDYGCYTYCPDTCYRSTRFEIQGEGTDNYKLKVCKRGDLSTCAFFYGSRRENANAGGYLDPRTFIAHLPTGGAYDAVFLDNAGLEIAAPQLLQEAEKSFCSSSDYFDLKLYEKLPIGVRQ